MLVVGADWHQIMAAVSSNIVVSMLMGGRFMATSSIIAADCLKSAVTSR
ncbi:L-alanine exporter AlaE [Escherichia coli]